MRHDSGRTDLYGNADTTCNRCEIAKRHPDSGYSVRYAYYESDADPYSHVHRHIRCDSGCPYCKSDLSRPDSDNAQADSAAADRDSNK